eukprot:Rmarinus@m.22871
MTADEKTPLWTPSEDRVQQSNMTKFMRFVEQKGLNGGKNFGSYSDLYQWSVSNVGEFWDSLWEFVGIRSKTPYRNVVDDPTKMPGAKWFEGCEINFAENLLKFRDEKTAIIFKGEGRPVTKVSYKELYTLVARCVKSFREMGLAEGDRVVGFMPNMVETPVAMLAATSLGAMWSSCSPDFGIQGVLDRFGQIKPKVLVTAESYLFRGKVLDCIDKVKQICEAIPSLEKILVVPYGRSHADVDLSTLKNAVWFDEFLADMAEDIEFNYGSFERPVYVMYSSGTTGLPKCMVQGPGVLVNQLKEHVLHTDLRREDVIFYFTTCGWMMWNWLICALGVGATLVLFDGSPFSPTPQCLWELAEKEGITVFGTSARYLAALEQAGVKPGKEFDLSALRAVCSTGSPLSPESFQYVYRDIKEDLLLASITGGTDINGCFALGCPIRPVYTGELQCRGLGVAMEVWNDDGEPVVNTQGELVCTKSFPSMPLFFWPKEVDDAKYKAAYFDMWPKVWRHGDFASLTERDGVVIHGRSDATLNPGGVRIGSADIYRIVETIEEVDDSVIVGQDFDNDVRIILFVKMKAGKELTDDIVANIKKSIRSNVSPRHVPAKVIAVPDIPYTLNMKKVEVAVKRVIDGRKVPNKDALANPESLEYFKDVPELQS